MRTFWEFLATGFYTGYLKKAPGTWGSLLATLMIATLSMWVQPKYWYETMIALSVFISILGIYASGVVSKLWRKKDPSEIVIDEWAGQFITLCFVDPHPANLILGFLLFRFFDITKIWPLKKLEKLPGGLGIMADDILGGLYAGAILHFLHH
jgi:phosphatidylglycerophosphatase A